MGRVIPNQAMLINTVVLQEAKASSELENVITTNDKLYKALTANTSNVDAATKEVLRYREAVWQGYRGLMAGQRMDANFFERLARTITSEDNRIRNRPGTNLKSDTTGEVIYTPPEGERHIRRMLRDLETFIYDRERFDPLLSMALVHYQFEAIHPFVDGNGRIGRLLLPLLMVEWKLMPTPLLYLSAYFHRQRQNYYDLLMAVSEGGAWRDWILFFLEGVHGQAQDAILRAKRLQDLQTEWRQRLLRPRGSALPVRLSESLFASPVVTIPKAQRILGVTYPSAQRNVQELVAVGILQQIGEARYGKNLIATEILQIIGES